MRGQASQGGRRKTSSGAASPGWLARGREIKARGISRGSCDASHDDWSQAGASAQCPCFLFGAKEASVGEESRGIRQRFPYRCNETKTSKTTGRRSPWSPRRRHRQSLWQAKTTFSQGSLYWLSPFKSRHCGIPSRSIFGKRTRASINRTSHHHKRGWDSDHPHTHKLIEPKKTSPQEAVLPL